MAKPTNKNRTFALQVPTPDPFYPEYEDGTVRVSVSESRKTASVQVSVWGDDDYGFERVENLDSSRKMRARFNFRVKEVSNWEVVTVKMLEKQGFVQA